MGRFENEINKFASRAQAKLRAIARTSVQETVAMAQKTVGDGGRMRVDTGFLRASCLAQVDSMPRGPTHNEGTHGGKKKYPANASAGGEPVAVTLLRWDPASGQKLYVGWTANYARHREYKDGFLRGATEQWNRTVYKNVKRAGTVG